MRKNMANPTNLFLIRDFSSLLESFHSGRIHGDPAGPPFDMGKAILIVSRPSD
jgi:hypothetical protein